MSDQSPHQNNSASTGPTETESVQPALPSLRDTIEAAYDSPDEAAEPSESGQTDRNRDNLGRFVAKDDTKPGEQSADPAPKPDLEAQPRKPEPAPTGTQVPEHWSAEFKADFSKLPPEGQATFLNRYREMEADYTRKSQATAGAVQFASALEPVFRDPAVSASLQQSGMNAIQAIHEWGSLHKRAMSPDVRERVHLLTDLAERMGFDPARIFATGNRQEHQLSEEDMNDPAIRYFADKLGQVTSELNSFKAQHQQALQVEAQHRQEAVKDTYLQGINAFADEKDDRGNALHPYFDDPRVMKRLEEAYTVDPTRDLKQTYDEVCWAEPEIRRHMLEAERHQLFSRSSTERAKLAQRGNLRGVTSPVAKPNANANGAGGLRGTLEASADEVGF